MTIRYYATALVLLLSVLFLPAVGWAQATFTVDGTADGTLISLNGNGTCDLREAVEAANNDTTVGECTPDTTPGNDTILFDASLAGMTITLTTAGNTFNGFSALEVFEVTTIDGVDAPGLVITQAIPTTGGRIFYVEGVEGNGDLTLRNLTIDGGVAQGGNGGDAISGGAGGGGAGLGGAIFVSEADLTIEQCTFINNTAQGGNGGTTTAGDIEDNGGGGGGGLLGDGDPPSGTIGGDGGPNEGGDGGNGANEVPPQDGDDGFFGGGGGGGGGGFFEDGAFGGDGGFGGGGGGGGADGSVAASSSSKVSEEGGNGSFGGGIGGDGTFETGGTGGGGGGLGGALFVYDGQLTIRNSTFTSNTAQGGSAGVANVTGTEGEDGSGLGGAVFAYNSTLTVRHATFDANTADEGGGIYTVGEFILIIPPGDGAAAKAQGGADAFSDIYNSIFSNSMLPGGGATTDFVSTTENDGTELANGSGNLMESESGYDGTNASTADPQLETLADNGGPTQTKALMQASPAIDTADPSEVGGLNTDQRGDGFPRIVDGDGSSTDEPDIGAFEFALETATITIEKVAFPDDGTDFAFTGDFGPFTLDDADPDDSDGVSSMITFSELEPGTYNVAETVPEGWQLDDIDCEGGDTSPITDGVAITVSGGDEVTCTFFNLQFASITIIKDADPADGTDFTFDFEEEGDEESSAAQVPFVLDDAVPDDGDGVTNSMTFDNLDPGQYIVTEMVPEDWELEDIECTGGTEIGFVINGVSILLEPGDAVVCTFLNTQPGSLTIIKDAIPADGTDFEFTHTIFDDDRRADNAPAGGLPTFILDDAVPDDGDSFIDRITFEELEPGTYDILEDVPEGWTLIDIDCGSAPTEPLTDGISVTVGGGEDVVCTFTNSNVDIDLAITKEVDESMPDFGSNVVFTLVATNNSNVLISDVVVEDALPDGLTFVSANPSSAYNMQTGRWVIGNMPAGGETTLTITARVETLEETTNTATIFSRSTVDPLPENNTDSATITPIAADLELEKQRVSFAYNPGNGTYTVGFVITLTNHGPSDATNVEVTDFGEEGLTFVSATPSQGSYDPNFAPQTGLWYVGTLVNGASATLNVTVLIDEDDNEDGGLVNIAEVTASDQVDPDSVPADGQGDDFSGDVGLRGPIRPTNLFTDLALGKTVDNASPAAGTEVTYTLTLMNQSDVPTLGVKVTDLLPEGVTFVSATTSDPSDSYDPATGVWDVGRIIGGETMTLTITVMVTGSGEITNTAEVTASTLPDTDSEPNNQREIEDDIASASISVQVSNAKATDTELDTSVPTEFVLGPNYPNPFNPQTTIPYAVPEAAHVTIAIYDLLGRQLSVLVNDQMGAGRYETTWDAQNRPTGIYLVRLQAGSVVKTRRITLMK